MPVNDWVDDLVKQYKRGKRKLDNHRRKLPSGDVDRSTIGGMLADMTLAIDWMQRRYVPDYGRRKYRPPVVLDKDLFPSLQEPEDEWQPSREQIQIAKVALRRMTERERTCFVLQAQGMSMAEIGNKVGVSKRTVQEYIARAKKKIPASQA